MQIQILQIKVSDNRLGADREAVQKLADSISKVGLLNPITVDQEYTLIAGLHRLEAAKLLGWTEIACTVSSLDGLQAELAEIDENLIRHELDVVDESDQLARRKEIYEALYPQTKRGAKNQYTQNLDVLTDTVTVSKKSFVDDTAETMGVSPRTVSRKIQLAKNLSPDAKQVVKRNGIGMKNALKISRLEPELQAEAASQLATGAIQSVEEYRSTPAAPEIPPPVVSGGGYYATIKDSVEDLKNPDKDRQCTPENYLVTFSYFLQRFCQSMENYTGPEYDTVLPVLTGEHLKLIRQKIQLVHTALEELFRKIEGKVQNEAT